MPASQRPHQAPPRTCRRFDSKVWPVAITILATEIGATIPNDANIFDETSKLPRSIDETAVFVCDLLNRKSGRSMTELDSTKRSQIAQLLKEARKQAGPPQGHVARMLGLHRPSVSEIESGNGRVSAGELTQLAEIYDVSAAWLLGNAPETFDAQDPRLELGARELSKLKPDDLERLLKLLAAMRRIPPRTATIADKCDAHHQAQLQPPRAANQATTATPQGEAGPSQANFHLQAMRDAECRGALQQHQHGGNVSARRPSAHPSLCATAAAAARLKLRA